MTRTFLGLSAALALSACSQVSSDLDAAIDGDGDGVKAAFDCDDTNAGVFPGAEEICNDIDDDCNGAIDDQATDATQWFMDADGDGAAGTAMPLRSCSQPAGASAEATDCADLDVDRFPGAIERCNGLDDNCDGELDEDAGDRVAFYADADADGHGDAETSVLACAQPSEYVTLDDDCNDADATIFPGGIERCGPVDDDCDGLVDAADPDLDVATGTQFYLDRDADGFGSTLFPIFACELPVGASAVGSDCDDLSFSVNPGATELCNDRDDDCDGDVDSADASVDVTSGATFYVDLDGDGYGATVGDTIQACDLPIGFSATADDCDDASAAISPNIREVCNGTDDDCDGRVDDDDATLDPATATRWWTDRDGDGHGGQLFSIVSCDQPDGLSADSADCDDDNPDISPSAIEVCDTVDNNCDAMVDDDDITLDTSTALPWHPDADGDGWGASDETLLACVAPEGFGQDTSDCDDENADISPGVDEICNGIDDDCDEQVDDNDDGLTSTGANYWRDLDGDGWGTEDQFACSDFGFGWAAVTGDCNDNRDDVYPQAPELCDNRDNNCDGDSDEDAVDASTFFVDNDRDDFGSDETILACSRPSDGANVQGDCDDERSDVNPDEDEVCDAVDNNCNGTIDLDTPDIPSWYVDADGDTWGESGTGIPACVAFDDRVSLAGDCDDASSPTNPGQSEIDGDGVDNDCDGQVDVPTVVSGQVIESSLTWGYADSPAPFDTELIEVDGNILISSGATLDIAPCTQISFAAGRALQVDGELIARGTEDCRIRFLSAAADPAPGDWGRIYFTSSSIGTSLDDDGNYESGSILEYVDITHAGGVGEAALEIRGSSGGPVLSNIHVAYSEEQALYADSDILYIEDSVFEESGDKGVYVSDTGAFRNNQVVGSAGSAGNVEVTMGDAPEFTGNIIRDNNDGIRLAVSSSATVSGNWFIDNDRTGLELDDRPRVVFGNVFIGNQWGLELEPDGSRVLVNGNVFVGQTEGAWKTNDYSTLSGGDNYYVEMVANTVIGNAGAAETKGHDGAYVTHNLFQGHVGSEGAMTFGVDSDSVQFIVFEDNAFVGEQVEPWLDVGISSDNDFVDVTHNYWDGREDPGFAIQDFLVDSSRTVASFSPTLPAIADGVPVSYPQDIEAASDGSTVTLSWGPNPEADIAGYRVWYGLSTDDEWALAGSGATEGASGFDVFAETATVSGLDLTQPWRFSVSAVDVDADGIDDIFDGHESWPSGVVIP
ncbi:MAG: parallel beta-helix repeat protein [bacterium]|jgi:parallel beta-helix repeat protein